MSIPQIKLQDWMRNERTAASSEVRDKTAVVTSRGSEDDFEGKRDMASWTYFCRPAMTSSGRRFVCGRELR